MLDPYGPKLCPHCGKPAFDTESKSGCSGPSIEEMHANVSRNLKKFRFLSEIPANYEC